MIIKVQVGKEKRQVETDNEGRENVRQLATLLGKQASNNFSKKKENKKAPK